MSDSYQPGTPEYRDPGTPTWTDQAYAPSTTSNDQQASGTADVAKEQAAAVKDTTVDAAKGVAGTAKDEAKNVASEAKSQAKNLLGETRSQLSEQAGEQQKRVASGLHSISDELHQMADKSDSDGQATGLVKQAASRAGDVASWLDARDPGSLLDEVSRFARQRPGTFIAIAAVAGVLAGRLTGSLVRNARDEKESTTPTSSSTGISTPSAAHLTEPPATTAASFSERATPTVGATTGAYASTTDNFDSAGDYLGSGDPAPDDAPLSAPEIDEPPLSVGNEPYRTPTDNQYGSDYRP